jgi:hypothetical protein
MVARLLTNLSDCRAALVAVDGAEGRGKCKVLLTPPLDSRD